MRTVTSRESGLADDGGEPVGEERKEEDHRSTVVVVVLGLMARRQAGYRPVIEPQGANSPAHNKSTFLSVGIKREREIRRKN